MVFHFLSGKEPGKGDSIMTFDMGAVRHPKEKLYGAATLIMGAVLWMCIVALVFAGENPAVAGVLLVFYALVIWGASSAARALMRAYMLGHYVMVGPDQFPHLHTMVAEGAKKLGLDEAPATFVYNSSGVMNAVALRLIGKKRYVWLTSALIDADNDEQLRFVIGHELGHHVAGHLDERAGLLRMPAMMVPFLGAAYSRSRELTCDRVGAHLVRDLNVSRTALQMLACGSAKLNAQMNGVAFAAQDKLVPPIAGFFVKIVSNYPRLTRRVDEVAHWLESNGHVTANGAKPEVAAAA
jgi:Zn-dependent protease with chaperone function